VNFCYLPHGDIDNFANYFPLLSEYNLKHYAKNNRRTKTQYPCKVAGDNGKRMGTPSTTHGGNTDGDEYGERTGRIARGEEFYDEEIS
jgi:hypothetical protein